MAPPHASSGGTLRSILYYAPKELRRIPPLASIHGLKTRGFLRRRVILLKQSKSLLRKEVALSSECGVRPAPFKMQGCGPESIVVQGGVRTELKRRKKQG
jgi:hypothetical protein